MTARDQSVWPNFYKAFAEKLLPFKTNRGDLINLIKQVYTEIDTKLPTLEKGNNIVDIDPFTVVGLFNKGITESNREKIMRAFASHLEIPVEVPVDYLVPVLNNQNATFYPFIDQRGKNDIDLYWNLFEAALNYADNQSVNNKASFISAYDSVWAIKYSTWKVTMGLFWIGSDTYMTLDGRSRWYIDQHSLYTQPLMKMAKLPKGTEYLDICNHLKESSTMPFYELSLKAFQESQEQNDKDRLAKKTKDVKEDVVNKCWYVGATASSMGKDYCKEFLESGIWRHGFGEGKKQIYSKVRSMKVGDKIAIKASYRQKYGLPFANYGKDVSVMSIKAIGTIIENPGDGKTVKVDWRVLEKPKYWYFYTYQPTIWEVKRTENWLTGALLDFTFNDVPQDYSKFLNEPYWKGLYSPDLDEDSEDDVEETALDSYTKEEFLKEVYMLESKYDRLASTLLYKKNIILQGAPGVGKTYAARRLAYSIMGCKDKSKVEFVQFHQSYAYEDFVQGYKPVENGFELKNGIFYKFCQKAKEDLDPESKYFFIIDEINRGNLSRIFGELLMLIEKDYRGEKAAVHLAYSQDEDEKFSIPENIYIIGMMNTADRSLAIMDYALRRRFSFFEFVPAFNEKEADMATFWTYVKGKNNPKFEKLIKEVQKLNDTIAEDESLGKGFRIGHSYFITEEPVTDELLTNIVENELVPLLEEYWFDAPEKANDYSNTLRESIK